MPWTSYPAEVAWLEPLLQGIREREAASPDAYPAETVAALYAARIPSAPFGGDRGGTSAFLAEAVTVVELLSTASPSAALITSMPLGLAGAIEAGLEVAPEAHAAAANAQADRIAQHYREGLVYAACNSEKGAGGALEATKTSAGLDARGHFVLTGEKILASSGAFASRFFSTARVSQGDLPGAGIVEFFLVPTEASGVDILSDWDGFGMRSTESQTVVYRDAPAEGILGYPNFLETVQPLTYWFCLFAAIPLGCARAILETLSQPAPSSPALRLRLSEARMHYESLRAYLLETSRDWRPGADPAYRARVLRTKTFVTQESTKLAAELFALSGGRHFRRSSPVARALADSFAGTALRPPLPLALDQLVEGFGAIAE